MANNFRYFRVDNSISHQRLMTFDGFEVSGGTGSAWYMNEQAVVIGAEVEFDEQNLWSFGEPTVGRPY